MPQIVGLFAAESGYVCRKAWVCLPQIADLFAADRWPSFELASDLLVGARPSFELALGWGEGAVARPSFELASEGGMRPSFELAMR